MSKLESSSFNYIWLKTAPFICSPSERPLRHCPIFRCFDQGCPRGQQTCRSRYTFRQCRRIVDHFEDLAAAVGEVFDFLVDFLQDLGAEHFGLEGSRASAVDRFLPAWQFNLVAPNGMPISCCFNMSTAGLKFCMLIGVR
jgi:hypothetical protein